MLGAEHDPTSTLAQADEVPETNALLQTLNCPWCGTALRAHHDVGDLPLPAQPGHRHRGQARAAAVARLAAKVERLREVRALIGFTRLDAPDPGDPTLVTRVELARDAPTWVPASEVRGEGIF
ncbi:MAG TPA: hypothetical protein VN748_10995 [Pseudonocardiaceae bacterium]|jgi:hypothetical protein|nr:hypothetical protein [Pseudonocardiaceae bacterium]